MLGQEFPGCYRNAYGVFLWTAGYVKHNSGNNFVGTWNFITPVLQIVGPLQPDPYYAWGGSFMNYQVWDGGQPDNSGGKENCVNIWPHRGYTWNDDKCYNQYCFVCQDRAVDE